ncbi:MAG: hypothetical protein H6595_04630 [Flavobacteriales bacterium]|nr:hypothetical protein [Flavobacteriales bacterium]
MMTRTTTFLALLATTTLLHAQYGTFDAAFVKDARARTTLVVLDDGDSPYNRAMIDAVKANWKFTGTFDFVHVGDLATQPMSADNLYLLKSAKNDPEKHTAVFLTLIQGWKQKKNETMQATDNAFTTIPADQELAFIMIDPKAINEQNTGPMLNIYVKHLQDYLGMVEKGQITDKTTADRIYDGRTRLIRDTELLVAEEHLDKSVADAGAIKAEYQSPVQVVKLADLVNAVKSGDRGKTVTDMLLTGDYKTKWCFKRVFNAGTGELMFQSDDAALYGKKEGFLIGDFKSIERAR